MPSFRRQIGAISRNKRLEATIVEIMNNLVSVRLIGGGEILSGIPFIGLKPGVGQKVYVDYASGSPIVYFASEQTTGMETTTQVSRPRNLEPSGTSSTVNADTLDGLHANQIDADKLDGLHASEINADRLDGLHANQINADRLDGYHAADFMLLSQHRETPQDINFFVNGRLAVTDRVDFHVVTRDTIISSVYIYCDDIGVSGITSIDLLVNGSSIFSTPPELPYNTSSHFIRIPVSATLLRNDVVVLDIVGVAVKAGDLRVTLTEAVGISSGPLNPVMLGADNVMIGSDYVVYGSGGSSLPANPVLNGLDVVMFNSDFVVH